MRKKGRQADLAVALDEANQEVSKWLIGKSLLNGSHKISPDLQALLDSLGVKVTQIVTSHGPEPMICIKGLKGKVDAIAAIAKAKVA